MNNCEECEFLKEMYEKCHWAGLKDTILAMLIFHQKSEHGEIDEWASHEFYLATYSRNSTEDDFSKEGEDAYKFFTEFRFFKESSK